VIQASGEAASSHHALSDRRPIIPAAKFQKFLRRFFQKAAGFTPPLSAI
jgi:hypothetical protein